MTGPLEGIRIIDLTQVLFGPFATMLLSELGAEVIKVENPQGGDIARGNGPFIKGVSTYFLSLNRGKKSVTIDTKSPAGKELLLKLVEKADVVMENFRPGTMEKLGLGYETLKKRNSRIVYVAGSGFGQSGPYASKPAFDIIIQAMGGIMSFTGEPGRPPVKPGVSYGDIVAGLFMCITTLAALKERDKSGEGQMADISMLDCQITAQENAFVRYLNTGELPRPLGTRHQVITPFQVFPTADGYIAVAPRGGVKDQWPLFCAVIGRTDIIDDPKFANGWLRTQNYNELEPIMNEALKTRTTQEWIHDFEEVGIPCGPLNDLSLVAKDPQILARDMFVDVSHHAAGTFKVVNTPFKFSRSKMKSKRVCPDLGQQTQEVLESVLGMSAGEIAKLKESGVI